MEPEGKNTKTVLFVLIGMIVVLLLVIAFLLGKQSGEKKPSAGDPAQPGASSGLTVAEGRTQGPSVTVPLQTDGGASAATERATVPAAAVGAPRNLSIDMSAGSLTFSEGEAFRVDFDDSVVRVQENGETLSISNLVSHPTASERRKMDVKVILPAGCAFGDVDISFGAGKLTVRSLLTETFSLELGAGSARFDSVTVTGSAQIREGAGELNIGGGSMNDLTLQCGAGATRVKAALTGACRVQAAVGAVDLDLEGVKSEYTVAFQMGLGACYFNDEKIARSGSFGEGPNRVDIVGGLGVMRVRAG